VNRHGALLSLRRAACPDRGLSGLFFEKSSTIMSLSGTLSGTIGSTIGCELAHALHSSPLGFGTLLVCEVASPGSCSSWLLLGATGNIDRRQPTDQLFHSLEALVQHGARLRVIHRAPLHVGVVVSERVGLHLQPQNGVEVDQRANVRNSVPAIHATGKTRNLNHAGLLVE
jgi:hypothetical protein